MSSEFGQLRKFKLVFLGEQSGKFKLKFGFFFVFCMLKFYVLPENSSSWQDITDHTLHVRQFRQYIPGHDWHRLSIENHVFRGPDRSFAIMVSNFSQNKIAGVKFINFSTKQGHGRSGAFPITHSKLYPRLHSCRHCLRYN
jgi:hypothetical protein